MRVGRFVGEIISDWVNHAPSCRVRTCSNLTGRVRAELIPIFKVLQRDWNLVTCVDVAVWH